MRVREVDSGFPLGAVAQIDWLAILAERVVYLLSHSQRLRNLVSRLLILGMWNASFKGEPAISPALALSKGWPAPMSHLHAPPSTQSRLENVRIWIRTAKQNIPALNNGAVTTDHVAEMSALLDRMHGAVNRRCVAERNSVRHAA